MKVMILGCRGLLGSALRSDLAADHEVFGYDSTSGDVRNEALITALIGKDRPDVIVNCAGFLNADRCEGDPARSFAVNALGPGNVMRAAQDSGISPIIVHFSSDFVFDGAEGNYGEEARPHPLSIYGLDKCLADQILLQSGYKRVYVLRVASLIGDPARKGFLWAVLRKVRTQGRAAVVEDLRISVATVELVAAGLRTLVLGGAAFGLYNCVANGETSWFSLAARAAHTLAIPGTVVPQSSEGYSYAASRPKHSSLATSKLGALMAIPTWEAVLDEHLARRAEAYRSLTAE